MQETGVRSLGQEDPLEKGTATHSSVLAWSIPWKKEPGGLSSMGSQRVGHYWVTRTFSFKHKLHCPCIQFWGLNACNHLGLHCSFSGYLNIWFLLILVNQFWSHLLEKIFFLIVLNNKILIVSSDYHIILLISLKHSILLINILLCIFAPKHIEGSNWGRNKRTTKSNSFTTMTPAIRLVHIVKT